MGLIQGLMKAVPADQAPDIYLKEVLSRLPSYASGAEASEATLLRPEQFTEAWATQDNLKRTPEIEAKYQDLTKQGRVVYVEIDW